MLTKTFNADRLRIAREQAGLTQSELAGQAVLTRGAIASYEAGRNVPSANVLAVLAQYLAKPLEYFFVCPE